MFCIKQIAYYCITLTRLCSRYLVPEPPPPCALFVPTLKLTAADS